MVELTVELCRDNDSQMVELTVELCRDNDRW